MKHNNILWTSIILILLVSMAFLAFFLGRIFVLIGLSFKLSIILSIVISLGLFISIFIKPIPIKLNTIFVLYFLMFGVIFELVLTLLNLLTLRDSGVLPILLSILLIIYSKIHGKKTILRTINIPKHDKPLKIGIVSDVHMGLAVNEKRLEYAAKLLNDENPDIFLILGDLIDDTTSKEDMELACKIMGSVHSKYGTYMILGNHDLSYKKVLLKFEDSIYRDELKKNNIRLLLDESIDVNGYTIIGRLDRGMKTLSNRKELNELAKVVTNPIILLDHQPMHVDDAIKNDIYLQLSGHTHGGQIFPANIFLQLVTKAPIYGLKKFKNTYIYTSCGLGTRGTTLRSGSTSEVAIINLI